MITNRMSDRLSKRGFTAPAALLQAGILALALGAGLAPMVGMAQAATAPAAIPAAAEYRLGSGDVIRINVYQNPDLTIETRVTEAGIVSYPLLGAIRLGTTGSGLPFLAAVRPGLRQALLIAGVADLDPRRQGQPL